MKDPKRELSKRYKNISILLSAVEKTIAKPNKSVVENLNTKDTASKALAVALIAGGASTGIASMGGLAAGTTALIAGGASTGVATVGGLAAGATATALGGPIVWTIAAGGAITSLIYYGIEKVRSEKKKQEEKNALLKRIIAKQQAIINKLSDQDKRNQEEIKNLKEALQMLKEAESQVRSDFAYA